MNKILVPPIKCQGIKTKLVPVIAAIAQGVSTKYPECTKGRWIEPFMGSGVVGLNTGRDKILFADLNPHIIRFYQSVQSGKITPQRVRAFLLHEGNRLEEEGEEHYYFVRKRFNKSGNPFDFLFLSRSCFNGMIRFNSKGGFNVPFCRKNGRFAKAYITKIVNQLDQFQRAIHPQSWEFRHQDFEGIIEEAEKNDIIYCDPPYLGRHADYYNTWTLDDEYRLFESLHKTKARFILSTWCGNMFRTNELLETIWSRFFIQTFEHYYHLGGHQVNRNPMLEAIITNFPVAMNRPHRPMQQTAQPLLFD